MKSIPPEQWPKWREEQERKDQSRRELIAWIDRCLDDGTTIFTKRAVLDFGRGNFEVVVSCFEQWEANGVLEILKPLGEANDHEDVIKMKKFIARATNSYPGNWPFEKPSSAT